LGFDPIVEAIMRFRDPNTPNRSKDVALTIVADRFAPRLKSIEVTGDQSNRLAQVMINVIAAGTASGMPPEVNLDDQGITPRQVGEDEDEDQKEMWYTPRPRIPYEFATTLNVAKEADKAEIDAAFLEEDKHDRKR
jgi:hypothetical protein